MGEDHSSELHRELGPLPLRISCLKPQVYHYIRVPVRGISLTQNMLYSGTAGGLCSVYVVGISQFKPVFNLRWGGADGGTFLFHLLYPSHSLFSQVPTPCPPLLRYQD